jgi:elongation factor 1-beta
VPDVNTHPNLHYWYLHIGTFSPFLLKALADKHVAAAPKVAAKKDDDEVDLFGDDEPAAATPVVEKPKPKVEIKKKKEKPIAKSIVVFEVKVYEAGFDLIALANKVYALEIDGLIWNKEPKILEVAYGVQKLQVGCVIEDDKVLTDDIFDKITAWEDDVQSVDMISMQKL